MKCLDCGKKIDNRSKYCSRECYYKSMRGSIPWNKGKSMPKGVLATNWKGGEPRRKEYMKKYNKEYVQIHKEDRKNYNLLKKYGITTEQKEHLRISQDNRCITCSYEFIDLSDAYVDHNHKTGKIRKLLCSGCNFALGHAKENPEILRSIANYIENEECDS